MVNVLRYFESPGALVFANTRERVKHLTASLRERGFDVGPVVVAYLQRRPAAAPCREVFVQVRGEPTPMTSWPEPVFEALRARVANS